MQKGITFTQKKTTILGNAERRLNNDDKRICPFTESKELDEKKPAVSV
jgi:hypothetical protein